MRDEDFFLFHGPKQLAFRSAWHTARVQPVWATGDAFQKWRLLSRWVDEVVEDAPWVVTEEFLTAHDIDYVTHDALPYSDATGQGNDVYETVRAC